MAPTTRGAKDKKDLPPKVKVYLDKSKPKALAIAPGMDVAALKASLKHLLKEELKGYDKEYKDGYELIGVQLKHVGDDDKESVELVPLDTLARVPAIANDFADTGVELVLSVGPPKAKPSGPPIWFTLAAAFVALFIGRIFVLRSLLRKLYRTGPSFRTTIGTFGFWEGQSLPNICAQLTGAQDPGFWRSNREQCVRIFSSREEGFIIAVELAVLAVVLYSYVGEIKKHVASALGALFEMAKKLGGQAYKPIASEYEKKGKKAGDWEKEQHKALSEKLKEQLVKYPWIQFLPAVPLVWLVLFYGPFSPILQ